VQRCLDRIDRSWSTWRDRRLYTALVASTDDDGLDYPITFVAVLERPHDDRQAPDVVKRSNRPGP
jgi:hypothetical protein